MQELADRFGVGLATIHSAATMGEPPRQPSMTRKAIYMRALRRIRRNEPAGSPEPLGCADLRPAPADALGVVCLEEAQP